VGAILAAFDPHAFRFGASSAPLGETAVLVGVLGAMAATCLFGVRSMRRHRRRRGRVADQWQVQSEMGELCPGGWQARLTVYGGSAELPADAPASLRGRPVELEWRLFDQSSGAVFARRLWARSIPAALEAMIDDRRTDVSLERAMQTGRPTVDGLASWPSPSDGPGPRPRRRDQ
jgi:hypothetical protein